MKNKRLGESFKNACNGFKVALTRERNMKIHILAVVIVLIMGIFLKLDILRWAALILVMALVLAAELFNTAVENMVDMITHQYSEKARAVKDMAAAAVLIASVTAVAVGILVFAKPVMDKICVIFSR